MQNAQTLRLLDAHGQPLTPSASSGGYTAARAGRELASWSPALRSPDADLLPDLPMLQARTHDLARNYALVAGGMQVQLDNIIGGGLKLCAKPDYLALGVTPDWAEEWARNVEARFRLYADDLQCYCDVTRRQNLSGLIGLAYRSFLTTGEILAVAEWLPRHPARYATALRIVDPARLTNPYGLSDTDTLRGGVELDRHGAPSAYHIRSALPSDARFGADTCTWRRVPRETPWGRAQIIHLFEPERPGQTRGKAGIVAGLAKAKMLEKFQGISLEAAIVNAMYTAVIESEFNFGQAADAMGKEDANKFAQDVLGDMANFHAEAPVKLDGVKIPHLYPGERLVFTPANHPGPNFGEFEKSTLRHLAAAFGISYEQLARDYSETNYSGARAGMIEAWKFFSARRKQIAGLFATQIYTLWLEEAIDRGEVELPPGAPDFYTASTAWARCDWIGPGRGHIDPLKEGKATQLEMQMGTLTLEEACAERGLDWEETLVQISREQKRIRELGIGLNLAANFGVSAE
ncbi:MAG: phage portal protein [Betaproteobacteria bacterium]|nr:phage portal protein [Betaproteobacteria bacterium]